MPVFSDDPNGVTLFIRDHTIYPKEARKNKIEGKVYIEFVVLPDGSVTDVRILPGREIRQPLLEEEALRVCKTLPPFKYPGMVNGKPVPVRMLIPLTFLLPK